MAEFSSVRRARVAIAAAVAQAFLISTAVRAQGVPAFSGADGAGAGVTGGRGGSVYHVTLLDTNIGDMRPGTLQYGLSHASGPTTIVFDVGGTIWIGRNPTDTEGWDTQETINIPQNVTLAGQTAPGGITIMGGQVKVNGKADPNSTLPVANDIIRNVTLAAGYGARQTNTTSGFHDSYVYDNMDINSSGVMIDHVTALFATDESISANENANNVTVQYSTIAQGQSYPQADPEGNGSYASHALGDLWSLGSNAASTFSHNLYVNEGGRIPTIQTETSKLTKDGNGNYIPAYTDFRNNVVYNWYGSAGYGSSGEPGAGEFEGNYYKVGLGGDSASGGSNPAIIANVSAGTSPFKGSSSTLVFQTGNVLRAANGTTINLANSTFGSAVFTPASTFAAIPYNGVTDSANNAFTQVTNYAGANWQSRDAIDTRLVSETINRTGKIAALDDTDNGYNSAGQYVANDPGNPDLEWNRLLNLRSATNGGVGGAGTYARAGNYDTDHDGMPDVWEAAMGLNPNVADNNGNAENNGYTNLENFLNELAAWPASTALVFTNTNGNMRYAEIGNWQTGVYEPSRYDSAQVNGGTAKVDVVGQHAATLSVATNSGNTATLSVTAGWIDIAQSLLVGPGGTGVVTQTGGIVHAGTSVVIGGTNNAGTYTLSNGTLATALLTKGTKGGTFTFTGGTLHATTVNFSLTNQGGTLAPGGDAALQAIATASMPDINNHVEQVTSAVGTTHVVGNLTLQSGALEVDLTSLSIFDKLTVDNTLTLGGNLSVVLDNGYAPAVGTMWEVGMAGGISGSFSSVTPGFSARVIGNNLFVVAAPEPTSLAMLSLAGIGLLRRRWRRR